MKKVRQRKGASTHNQQGIELGLGLKDSLQFMVSATSSAQQQVLHMTRAFFFFFFKEEKLVRSTLNTKGLPCALGVLVQ